MVGDNLYGTGGQPFRFWGLGQGDLGFRGGLGTTLMRFGDSSLGFGGWDKVTFSAAFFTCFSRQLFSAVFLSSLSRPTHLTSSVSEHLACVPVQRTSSFPPTPHHQWRSIWHVCNFKARHQPPPHTISCVASHMCASSRNVIIPPKHPSSIALVPFLELQAIQIWNYKRPNFGGTSDPSPAWQCGCLLR